MKRKLLYIINPVSGTSVNKTVRKTIESETRLSGLEYAVYPSVETGDYSFLHEIIKEEKFTDVIIAGGDGTINQVISNLKELPVIFGIVPCGSGNGLAFTAGIPKNSRKALKIIFKGKSKWTDAFMVNKVFACMLCGMGLDAKVAHDFANDPRRGLITYIKKTFLNFFTSKSYPFILEINKEEISIEALFISIANSNQFGNHVTIAPKAILNDGLIDVVVMTSQNKLSLLIEAIRQVGGYNSLQQVEMIDKDAEVIYFQTEKLVIYNPGLAPMHIDGDPVETEEKINIQCLKSSFRLICP